MAQQVIQIESLVDGQNIRWFNISLLLWSWLAMFADGFDISALSFAVPELVREWHQTGGAFKTAQSASNLGVLFGAPLLGYIGDRFGRRAAIVLGSVIFGVFTLSMTQATSPEQLSWLRFLTGIGIGGLMPNTIALNAELAPRRWRALLVVLMFTGITLGSGTPGAVAGWLVPHFGWKVLFLVGGVVPLAVAACVGFVLPESVKFLAKRPDRQADLLKTARAMRPDLQIDANAIFIAPPPAGVPAHGGMAHAPARGIRLSGLGEIFRGSLKFITPLLWICFITTLMANFFLNSWIPLILENNGLTPKEAAFASAGYHVGGTIGGLLVSLLLNRYGYSAIVALFVLAPIAIFSMGIEGNTHAITAFITCVTGFAVLGVQFGNNACAGLIYPTEARSNGVGFALGIGRLGAIVGPYVGGMLIDAKMPLRELFTWASIPMAVGLIAAIGVAALCYVRFKGFKLDERPAEPEGPATASTAAQPS